MYSLYIYIYLFCYFSAEFIDLLLRFIANLYFYFLAFIIIYKS